MENEPQPTPDQIERASAAAGDASARASEDAPPLDRLTLSSGVVLKLSPVAAFLLRRAQSEMPVPKVPMVHNADRGRDEPNEDDYTYRQEVAAYNEAVGEAAINVMILRGAKVEGDLPEGVPPLEDESWELDMAEVGMKVRTTPTGRRLDWLKYVVLADTVDLYRVTGALSRLSGLNEEDVMAAINSFRGDEERGADNRVAAPADLDGDRVPADGAGDGA